jgi:malonyl CoA-acyl carrier protein transacylase
MFTQEALAKPTNGSASTAVAWDTELLVVHGNSRAALQEAVRVLADHLRVHSRTNLTDLAFTLNSDLPAGGSRLAVVAATASEAAARLNRAAGRLADPRCTAIRDAAGIYFTDHPLHQEGKIALLFPGEGAQYLGMLQDLRNAMPDVALFFAECDAALMRTRSRPLTDVFLLPDDATAEDRAVAEVRLRRLDNAIMSVLMADWALYQLLLRLGVAPDVTAGHSMGELTALWAAEALQTDDLFLTRVRVTMEAMQRQEEEGGGDAVLLAVGAGRATVVEFLAGLGNLPVTIAMENCPHQVVIVGPPAPMAAVEAELHRRRVVWERLPFRRPYHTADFAPLLEPVRELFEQVRFQKPRLPVWSCTTALRFPEDPAEIRHLAVRHWAEPVRFTELIENLHADGVRFFLESGPRGNLSAFVEDILRGKPFVALPANVMRRSGVTQLHHMLGCLAAHHVPLRLGPLYEHRLPRRLNLPGRNPRPAPMLGAAPTGSSRERVMKQYLGVMERFLGLQQEMTTLFLRRGCSAPSRPLDTSPEGRRRESEDDPVACPPGLCDNLPNRPLLGRIERHIPGREVVVRRVMEIREDRFATEHTVGGRSVSKVDLDQHGLPVMPMTFTLEMMAETATLLAPGKVLTAVRGVQLFRWLDYDEEKPGAVELVARVVDATGPVRIEAEVRDLGSAAEPTPSPWLAARATLILDTAYPNPPQAAPFQLTGDRPSHVSLERMYINLFHGPLLQGVRSTDRVGEEGIESRVEVLPREGLFRSCPNPDFLLDPVLLDVVMHPLASWHLEQPDQAGRILLPVELRNLEFFGPPPPVGTYLSSRGRVSETAVRSFVHDVEVVAADGRVWGRLSGVKYWRFYVPFGRVNFHGPKDQYFLSRRWTEIEAQGPAGNSRSPLALMRFEPPTDLQQAALHRVTARVTLSPQEMQEFRRLPRGEKSRTWLFDHIAAKDAIRVVWRDLHHERLFPADIDMIAGPSGCYRGRRRDATDQLFPRAAVDRAGVITAGLAVADAPRIGLALELLAGTEPLHVPAFDPAELELLAACGGDRAEAVGRFHAARRAVAQALKLAADGLAGVHVYGIGTHPGSIVVTVAGTEQRSLAYTARDGDVIVAWTVGEEEPS